jgi:hypothetical protein
MFKKTSSTMLIAFGLVVLTASVHADASVLREGERVFIVDRTGYRWDVTQASSIGFKPRFFQYGIGKYAFRPLDDTHMKGPDHRVTSNPRIIGVTDGTEEKAYSVRKLSRHEIANSRIGDTPIAAAY